MDTASGGQNFRTPPFRKTVARLVALALTQAPKVLMDVFGHKSIEMTLYYILADKDLRAEIEKVSRELRILSATQAIAEMVANDDSVNSYGGPAAGMLKTAISTHKQRVHQLGGLGLVAQERPDASTTAFITFSHTPCSNCTYD